MLNIFVYNTKNAQDHIYGVVHPALSALNWKDFLPELKDIEAMTKIITKFLPQSHAFLGLQFFSHSFCQKYATFMYSPFPHDRTIS